MKFSYSLPMLAALTLSGCATFSADGGMDVPAAVVKQRTGKNLQMVKNDQDAQSVHDTVKAILQKPLSVDNAVQVALINNRGLQITYGELGIAEADLVEVGRLQNPGFSFKHTSGGGTTTIERILTFNLINLITAPLASRIEGRQFEATKLLVADAALKVAVDTRKAYFETVAAQQGLAYAKQVNTAAEASAGLAGRMAAAGNWSQLEQAREQAFYAEATANIARASKAVVQARERLTRLMGLYGEDIQYRLPERMPELPKQPFDASDVESFAMAQRLDIQAAKMETERTASSLGLTKATRFINVLDAGPVLDTATGQPRSRGYEISIEIPIFSWGDAKTRKAETLYMQSAHRLADKAINARSEVRETYVGYRSAYDLAKHYRDEIVPLRKKISDENLLRYNGMLISVFELLADARDQVASVNAYIQALKDFWMADADLQTALGGALPNNESKGTVK